MYAKKDLYYFNISMLLLILTAAGPAFPGTVTSQCSGYWYDRGTWKNGAVPVHGDSVEIKHYVAYQDTLGLFNNYVTVDSGAVLCGEAEVWFDQSRIDVYGEAYFNKLTGYDGQLYNFGGTIMIRKFDVGGRIGTHGVINLAPWRSCADDRRTCTEEYRDTIVTPASGKIRVTLTQASATLISDVYLTRPESILLIKNNLTNVGTTLDTVFNGNSTLEFGIVVHGPRGNYTHLSSSKYALVETLPDSVWEIRFEDLPDSSADWDYDDVVLLVEFIPIPIPKTLRLLSPGEDDTLEMSKQQLISWTSTGEFDFVNLEYSDGENWHLIEDSTLNDGEFLWTVPDTPIEHGMVRITIAGDTISSVSMGKFTIKEPMVSVSYPYNPIQIRHSASSRTVLISAEQDFEVRVLSIDGTLLYRGNSIDGTAEFYPPPAYKGICIVSVILSKKHWQVLFLVE